MGDEAIASHLFAAAFGAAIGAFLMHVSGCSLEEKRVENENTRRDSKQGSEIADSDLVRRKRDGVLLLHEMQGTTKEKVSSLFGGDHYWFYSHFRVYFQNSGVIYHKPVDLRLVMSNGHLISSRIINCRRANFDREDGQDAMSWDKAVAPSPGKNLDYHVINFIAPVIMDSVMVELTYASYDHEATINDVAIDLLTDAGVKPSLSIDSVYIEGKPVSSFSEMFEMARKIKDPSAAKKAP